MKRRRYKAPAISFRLREDDFDLIALIQSITYKKAMSAMCREGLRSVLELQHDERDILIIKQVKGASR
jgi:hypothetical protein